MRKLGLVLPVALAVGVALSMPVLAKDLTMAIHHMAVSMDPQLHNSSGGKTNYLHMFEPLTMQDENQQLQPRLATSWKALDDTTWEFKLREGVKFHDGSPFTAEDVTFSVWRLVNIPNSDLPFQVMVKPIKEVIIKSPHLIHITTHAPHPLLPRDVSGFPIVSKAIAEKHMDSKEWNSPAVVVGTGPYKFVEFVPGERIDYKRNDDYWGGKEPWENVTVKLIAKPPARLAALLAGDVDIINNVPAEDLERLKQNADITLSRTVSSRIMHIAFDSFRDVPKHIWDNDGNPMTKNPLKDKRVREAISLAIDRHAIVEHVLEGVGIPAGQVIAEGFFGHNPALKAPKRDLERAKELLAEAGYPDGFQMQYDTSVGRYFNAPEVGQAIGQMMTQAGIKTKVVVTPRPVYNPLGRKYEYTMAYWGWGSDTGEAGNNLKAIFHSVDKATGSGTTNRGRYSNAAVDTAIDLAIQTIDQDTRERRLQDAAAIAVSDYGDLPLYFQVNIWASRKGLNYVARADEFTLAMSARPE
jgi:peptide/nickel transport system substrate-binding protein